MLVGSFLFYCSIPCGVFLNKDGSPARVWAHWGKTAATSAAATRYEGRLPSSPSCRGRTVSSTQCPDEQHRADTCSPEHYELHSIIRDNRCSMSALSSIEKMRSSSIRKATIAWHSIRNQRTPYKRSMRLSSFAISCFVFVTALFISVSLASNSMISTYSSFENNTQTSMDSFLSWRCLATTLSASSSFSLSSMVCSSSLLS